MSSLQIWLIGGVLGASASILWSLFKISQRLMSSALRIEEKISSTEHQKKMQHDEMMALLRSIGEGIWAQGGSHKR